MRLRPDIGEPGWMFWERRNLNMHRVVGLMQAARPLPDARRLDEELRSVLARHFKRAWWRGIAYGVVAQVQAFPSNPDDLRILVDTYENSKGTMQWVVLLGGDGAVTGVHNWIEGYLSPVYRGVLMALAERGHRVSSVRKEKDGLMRLLTGVAGAQATAFTGRAAFTEFVDPFPDEKKTSK